MYNASNRRFSSALAALFLSATLTLSAVAPDALQARGTGNATFSTTPSLQ